jgi:hypothetical protein
MRNGSSPKARLAAGETCARVQGVFHASLRPGLLLSIENSLYVLGGL